MTEGTEGKNKVTFDSSAMSSPEVGSEKSIPESIGANNKPTYESGEEIRSGGETKKNYDTNIPWKIGKGDDAKNSVVWHVVTYSLTIYSCIVAALLVIDVMLTGGKNSLSVVKDSWATFTPIITLSLGYMFGKKENDQAENSRSDGEKK